MKILISYDGSPHASAALRDLDKAGLPVEAKAVVMPMPESYLQAVDKRAITRAPPCSAEELTAMARQAGNMIRESFPGWEVRADVARGSIGRAISKRTSQWNPDLIVLGLRRDAETKYFGGVMRRIATAAKCPVRVARSCNAEIDEPPRVLLCVDGSPYTEAVVRVAASRDWPKGTEARILTVVNPDDYSIPEFADEAIERAKSMHRLIANEVNNTPAFTSSVIAEGDPKKVILRVIEEWDPDCVFLAPYERNRFSRALLGGVSGSILTQARCSIELARMANSEPGHGSFLRAAATSSIFNR